MTGPVVSIKARLFKTFRARGDRARDARDWGGAATEYRRALMIDDKAWPIWVQLGHALKEVGAWPAARRAYLKALRIHPATADTALHMGHLAKLSGDLDDARRWYARALIWPPGETDAAMELAALGVEGESLEALIGDIEQAYPPEPLAPTRREASASSSTAEYWARGDAARDSRDWTRAAAEYRRGLMVDETVWPMWVQLGHALKEAGDRSGALHAYQRALAIAPGVSDTALQLGHASKLLGDFEGACRWYARALIWPPGELDAAIELSRLGVEGAALESLIAALEPQDFIRPGLRGASDALRVAWALPVSQTPDAAAAWLADIVQAAMPRARPLSWNAEARRWSGEEGDGGELDIFLLTPGPHGLDHQQLAACRTLALHRGARIVLALPSAGALLAPARRARLADMMATASVILTFTAEDEGALRGRLLAAGLTTPLVRLELPPAPARRSRDAKGPPRHLDILLAGEEILETKKAVAAHARLGKGRTLHLETGETPLSLAEVDALLAGARSLVAPAAFPNLEVWLSRACDAGVPVMASARGPAYRLFGHALADYIDVGAAHDLAERWGHLGSASSAGEPDTPRWTSAILEALTTPGAQAWPSPLHRAPFMAFGDFRALGETGGGNTHCLGEGWAGFAEDGATLDGPATLRLRLPPHRSPVNLMVLFSAEAPGARLRMTARAGSVSARATGALRGRGWGWARVSLTPPIWPQSEINLDLSPAGAGETLSIAGFAAYPEREDRYWHELLDRAARGEAADLWRATRRLATPVAR